jgi:glucose/arabinose dehydrogenase
MNRGTGMMTRLVTALLVFAGIGCAAVAPGPSTPGKADVPAGPPASVQPARVVVPTILDDAQIPYRTDVVATGLDVPWELVFAPDGRLFFTERPGTVRVIVQGKLRQEPVISFPAPFVSEGEGGLLGLAVDPDFARNHYLYAYHTYREQDRLYNRVLRLREQNNRAVIDSVLIDKIPGGLIHNGGRIKIGPDRHLYITTGDAGVSRQAQDRSSLAGKILRIGLDGSIPTDNPFPGSPVYSYGHRNPQGLAWNPADGALYSSEHGSTGHDEINLIQPGINYGWPVIQGDEQARGMRSPVIHSGDDTWAPAGMTFASAGPWAGQLLAANLRGEQVLKIAFAPGNPETASDVSAFFRDRYGRLRNAVSAPDGTIYLLTSNLDGRGIARAGDDKIIRLTSVRP